MDQTLHIAHNPYCTKHDICVYHGHRGDMASLGAFPVLSPWKDGWTALHQPAMPSGATEAVEKGPSAVRVLRKERLYPSPRLRCGKDIILFLQAPSLLLYFSLLSVMQNQTLHGSQARRG